MTHKDCGKCGIDWDRKMNVKGIHFCSLHAAAPDLLAALEVITTLDGDRVSIEAAKMVARDAIKATKGDA